MGAIEVLKIVCGPNDCPLGDPLKISLEFNSEAKLPAVTWKVKYMVDVAVERHVIELGSSGPSDLEPGLGTFDFLVEGINLDGLKKKWVNNVGLFLVVLVDKHGADLLQISLVTQVELKEGGFLRHMINPLD